MSYPEAAWERAMKMQEVISKALSGEMHWFRAAGILGYSPRTNGHSGPVIALRVKFVSACIAVMVAAGSTATRWISDDTDDVAGGRPRLPEHRHGDEKKRKNPGGHDREATRHMTSRRLTYPAQYVLDPVARVLILDADELRCAA